MATQIRTPGTCATQEELRTAVGHILSHIDALNRQQIDALDAKDDGLLMRLDKQLETVFGEKERAFGALREHRKEHGC